MITKNNGVKMLFDSSITDHLRWLIEQISIALYIVQANLKNIGD